MLSLIAIKKYLQRNKFSSLQELSRIFNEDSNVLLELLQFFVNKQQVCLNSVTGARTSACGNQRGCSGCKLVNHQSIKLLIEWVG